ncbi:MAG: hypothetical protein ISR91_03090 [Candidatus Delongbacteria bacterium]|nr:hypothetical protein [bacterium]MBL7033107.1 hypothetical protein [Candidatus Delongbacteria bacterium]
MPIRLIALIICLTAGSLNATPLQEILLQQQLILSHNFPLLPQTTGWNTAADNGNPARSRFLKSLLIPGWGQLEEGHWIKAGIYLTVEAAFITGAVLARQRGREQDSDFKQYADNHWSFDDYRMLRNSTHEWGSDEEIPDLNYYGDPVIGDQSGSHTLPGDWEEGYGPDGADPDPYLDHFNLDQTQQYYEMIGKYAQFGRGWDDYGLDIGNFDGSWLGIHYFSPHNLHYMEMRDLSNRSFRLASNLIMGTLLNHFISAVDQIVFGDNGRMQLTSGLNADMVEVRLQLNL